jgi:hypothetical protein
MKNVALLFFIGILLLANPTGYGIEYPDSPSIISYDPASLEITRVYGMDYSQQIFSSLSLNSFRDYIIKLTENGSRAVRNPSDIDSNNIAARNWIVNELRDVSNGRIEVEILGEYGSVLGRLPGYLPVEAPALMVGGHYDTVGGTDGANDDGTGIATALEIARVMSKYNWPLDIYFGAWNAEEIGLLGSDEVAQILKNRGVKLLAYYNVDMLLVPDPEAPSVLMAYPIDQYVMGRYWADITKVMSHNYGQNMILPIPSEDFSGWHASDHQSFIKRGYTSLFAHESGFAYDTAYHTPADTWNNPLYDYTVAIEVVKAIGAAMAFTMARAYGTPTIHNLKFNLITSHEKDITFIISTPTTINVTARWYGGGTTISLYNANNQLLSQMVDVQASPWEQNLIISQSVNSKGIYRLNIANYGGTTVGHEITVSYDTDVDGNDIIDRSEYWFNQEYFSMDSDLDTISDAEEMIIGTLRNSADSDSDTLPDPWEIEYALDPLDPSDAYGDNDADGVLNQVEYVYNSNPNNPDSDSDSMPDLWEIQNGLNPTFDDSLEDPDNDAVINVKEYQDGTDPHHVEFRPERLVLPTLIVGSVAAIVVVAYKTIRRSA